MIKTAICLVERNVKGRKTEGMNNVSSVSKPRKEIHLVGGKVLREGNWKSELHFHYQEAKRGNPFIPRGKLE